MSISIRNQLRGTITEVITDKVVSEIVVDTAAGEVTSIITSSSVKRLNLKEGDQVFVLVKATEVSIYKEHFEEKREVEATRKRSQTDR